MSNFTPGPWVYSPDARQYPNAPFMVWGPRGPGYGSVAQTCSPGLMPTEPTRQAADARLIAAAPEMYGLLRHYVSTFTDLAAIHRRSGNNLTADSLDGHVREIRALLGRIGSGPREGGAA